jgi:hypothetical protein
MEQLFTAPQLELDDAQGGLLGSRLWWRALLATEVDWPTRLVAAILADVAGSKGNCWLSTAGIARLTGLSKHRARAAVRLLEANGWLTIGARRDAKGRQTSNRYWLDLPAEARVEVDGQDASELDLDDDELLRLQALGLVRLAMPWRRPSPPAHERPRCDAPTRSGRPCRREPPRGEPCCSQHTAEGESAPESAVPRTEAGDQVRTPRGSRGDAQGITSGPPGGHVVMPRGSRGDPEVVLEVASEEASEVVNGRGRDSLRSSAASPETLAARISFDDLERSEQDRLILTAGRRLYAETFGPDLAREATREQLVPVTRNAYNRGDLEVAS